MNTPQQNVNPQTVATAQQQLLALEKQLQNHGQSHQQLLEQRSLLDQKTAISHDEEAQLKAAIAAKTSELEQAKEALSEAQKKDFKLLEQRKLELKAKASKVNAVYASYETLLAELVEMGSDEALVKLSASLNQVRPLQFDNRTPERQDLKQDVLVVVDHGRHLALVPQNLAAQRNWKQV